MKAYYNEHDPKAAEWLRELIKEGHIAPGEVDERSICDVRATDLVGFGQCHFFAGIGGWSLGLRLAGVPDGAPVWTGSCPCQPFSLAGKGLGEADERHLWPVFFHLIRECGPQLVLGEQVASAIGKGWLDGVSADLESAGYACGAAVLGAHSVGAPHMRQRLYWMAHARRASSERGGEFGNPSGASGSSKGEGHQRQRSGPVAGHCSADGRELAVGHGANGQLSDPAGSITQTGTTGDGGLGNSEGDDERRTGLARSGDGRVIETGGSGAWGDYDILPCRDGKARRVEAGTFPLAHGVPGRVGLLRGYGNAIVPQVAAQFIQASLEALAEVTP